MKKANKILSVFLVAIMMFSVCSMMAGAVSTSSTKEEMLSYYESCLTTTAKKGLIKVDNTWKFKIAADYSGLSASDAKKTKEFNEELFGTDWNVEETTSYLYGTSDKSEYVDGQPDTVWMFSVKRRIKEFGFTFKSASLKKADNGDITITFKLADTWEDGKNDITITTKTSKGGLLKSFVMKQESNYKDKSQAGVKYPITESASDAYTITYKKVNVESVSLSESAVTLGYGETYDISVTVKPSNATYKDFYCYIPGEETEDAVASYVINDNGTITLTGVKGGTAILEVYSFDGAKVAECEVTVNISFFQSIINFFRSIIDFFANLFTF
ncbi:MAG: Ig domain-containing protein [Clostridia bacterium]|nr:Ig domain-containing protein [Clostridia bacterium]